MWTLTTAATEICQQAWVSSSLFSISRGAQEFGLACFRSNVTKTKKGFEYILAKLQDEAPSEALVETSIDVKEEAKETALVATEKDKDLCHRRTSPIRPGQQGHHQAIVAEGHGVT